VFFVGPTDVFFFDLLDLPTISPEMNQVIDVDVIMYRCIVLNPMIDVD
jgi:hypothetical protein